MLASNLGKAVTEPLSRLYPNPGYSHFAGDPVAADRFGLQPKPETQTQRIQSHLRGEFDGWEPRQKFTLANGQVWLLTEDSRGAYRLRNPKVTIRRGAIGSFLMDIEGVAQTLRVRRMQ